MKINELMIRDLVQVPSELNRYKKIRSTFDMDSAVLYKPIPLTTEILEKYGFVEKSERRWVLSDEYTGDNVIVLYEAANSFAMTTEGMTIGFQNVHELQHLFRLCGITKEIEL